MKLLLCKSTLAIIFWIHKVFNLCSKCLTLLSNQKSFFLNYEVMCAVFYFSDTTQRCPIPMGILWYGQILWGFFFQLGSSSSCCVFLLATRLIISTRNKSARFSLQLPKSAILDYDGWHQKLKQQISDF